MEELKEFPRGQKTDIHFTSSVKFAISVVIQLMAGTLTIHGVRSQWVYRGQGLVGPHKMEKPIWWPDFTWFDDIKIGEIREQWITEGEKIIGPIRLERAIHFGMRLGEKDSWCFPVIVRLEGIKKDEKSPAIWSVSHLLYIADYKKERVEHALAVSQEEFENHVREVAKTDR